MKTGFIAAALALIISAATVTQATAQEDVRDPKAGAILKQLREKNEALKSAKISFDYNMFHPDGIDETQRGEVLLQGKKYKVDMAGQTIICDGEAIYTIIDEVELQINDLPDMEDDATKWMNPQSMLSIDEKDFKYKHEGTVTENGKTLDVIKLFPVDAANASFHTITLKVDKAKMEPVSIQIKSKDGNRYTLSIKSFAQNITIPAGTFDVDPNDGKWEDVIDMRE